MLLATLIVNILVLYVTVIGLLVGFCVSGRSKIEENCKIIKGDYCKNLRNRSVFEETPVVIARSLCIYRRATKQSCF